MAEGPEPEPSQRADAADAPVAWRRTSSPSVASSLAGILGGIIGYGIADVSSQSDAAHLVGTLIGALIGAAGVGIVAVLVLRAMAEWRRQNPDA